MERKSIMPTVEDANRSHDEGALKFTHPAFGTVVVTNPRGGRSRMFGSRILHDSRIKLAIHEADVTRSLSHDWIHAGKTILELEFSETQWAQFVASEGHGSGTPCTFKYLPKGAQGLEVVPEIAGDPDARPEYHDELARAVRKEMKSIAASREELVEALESGKINKGTLRQAIIALDNAASRLPGTAKFIAKSFKEHTEEATQEAINNVEAFATGYARDLGLDVLKKHAEMIGVMPSSADLPAPPQACA